jgi:hypothetical protein
MKIVYLIKRKEGNEWVEKEDLGLFVSVDVANEKIYIDSQMNKLDFWTDYKVIQRLLP